MLGKDSFSVLPPLLQALKLYMPMTATYYDEEDPAIDIIMDPHEAAEYAPQIIAALEKARSTDNPEEGMIFPSSSGPAGG